MSIVQLEASAAKVCLDNFGAFHEDGKTFVLLGPKEPGYWSHITQSPEWGDGAPDPVDRWSTRVISELADEYDGTAHFPFGGEPYKPFFTWALKSGQAWQSPVSLLVHARAGLMVSYRGAIEIPALWSLPAVSASPCETCAAQPCRTACPSGALTAETYDVPKCHDYLDTDAGADNLANGCNVRRSCPVSQNYGRLAETSAYHMSIFHK